MIARLKCCLWCDGVFVGTREDFCERSCADQWRREQAWAAREARALRLARLRDAGARYWSMRKVAA